MDSLRASGHIMTMALPLGKGKQTRRVEVGTRELCEVAKKAPRGALFIHAHVVALGVALQEIGADAVDVAERCIEPLVLLGGDAPAGEPDPELGEPVGYAASGARRRSGGVSGRPPPW